MTMNLPDPPAHVVVLASGALALALAVAAAADDDDPCAAWQRPDRHCVH